MIYIYVGRYVCRGPNCIGGITWLTLMLLNPGNAHLFQKWMAGCKTVEEVSEKMVIEQLLNTMPSDLRIWIKEKFVLVLLPTTTSKFTAQWQGPYQVSKVVGKVNYLVDMDDRKKRKRIFHVNMLKKWQVQQSSGYLMKEVE